MGAHPLRDLHWSARLSAVGRQLLALVPALAIGFAARSMGWAEADETPWLAAWSVYCVIDLVLFWFLALRLDAHATRRRAQWNDPGAAMLVVLVTSAACASLVAVVLGVDTVRSLDGMARWGHLGLALLSLAGAWLLIQTTYALHYARIYYRPLASSQEPERGLAFPGEKDPDYLDFLYYAAVVGMTSQVSDVAVHSRRMRRPTLLHSVLSFAFNLVVLALAVNVLGDSLA